MYRRYTGGLNVGTMTVLGALAFRENIYSLFSSSDYTLDVMYYTTSYHAAVVQSSNERPKSINLNRLASRG